MKSVLTQQDRALMPPQDSTSACPAHLLLQVGKERGPEGLKTCFHSPPRPPPPAARDLERVTASVYQALCCLL